MTYEEQLQLPEWRTYRDAILKRDSWKCKRCMNKVEIDTCVAGMTNDTEVKFVQKKDGTGLNYVFAKRRTGKQGRVLLNENTRGIIESGSHIVYCKEEDGTDFQIPRLIRRAFKNEENDFIDFTDYYFNEYFEMNNIINENDYNIMKEHGKNAMKYVNDHSEADYINMLTISGRTDDKVLKQIKWDYALLHIHHTYYKLNSMAWEYPPESLETYCEACHFELHSEIKIPIYSKFHEFLGDVITCKKCAGSGYLPQYNYYKSGICFGCDGRGYYL